MYYHPTGLILLATIGLLASFRYSKLFTVIALGYPIIVAVFIYYQLDNFYFSLYNVEFISIFSDSNKLIGFAFLVVLFTSNIYSLGRDKKLEIILGSSYGAFSFLCLLAGDFISMFVGLELMILSSALIIFIGDDRQSPRAAKKYFITHLISSNMIIIGIAYLVHKTGGTALVDITPLMINPEYSKPILVIMLLGFIINIAAFPFSGWMVDYYTTASPSGFLYLMSFTTKVSIILLLKLFAGYDALKFVAILMIMYSSIKAFMENKLQALLCHLSIIQMGFMLLGISRGGQEVLLVTSVYLFIHIIYKSLLSLACASLIDYNQILFCSDLKKIKEPSILLACIIGIALMVNLPLSTPWYAKAVVSHSVTSNFIYFTILFSSLMTACSLPLCEYFNAPTSTDDNLTGHSKISLYFMTFIALFVGLAGQNITIVKSIYKVSIFSFDTLKQLVIISAAIGIIYFIKITKKHSTSLNLFEWLSEVFLSLYYFCRISFKSKYKKEHWSFKSLEQQTLNKFAVIHNQQTAIFMTFLVLLIMLVSLKFM